ncbi:glycosyltransferase family 4 protein [Candidatus Peregrinibacteria bacterium]|nr:MAG: glycosyltransferase family 4 protein [Candidatus Peregrinibacteria bacterium]
MKRILFYTDTPGFGGAEKQMMLLAQFLKPLGYRVDLACAGYSELREHEAELNEVFEEVHWIPATHKHDPRHFWALQKLLKKGGYDALHVHLWNPGAARYAFAAAGTVPLITTEHDPFELTRFKKWVKRWCLKRTAKTIVISRSGQELMAREFPEMFANPVELKKRLSVVHNGIDLDKFLDKLDSPSTLPTQSENAFSQIKSLIEMEHSFDNLDRKNDLLANNGKHTGGKLKVTAVQPVSNLAKFTILCVAELHERKGHRFLIEAFERLQSEINHLELILVGKGELEQELREKYGKNRHIHFLGWRQDVPQLMRASDVLVLPSLREAFGLVLVEAMASGTAVVATNNGGTVDIVEDGKSGFLVPPQSANRLADAIRILIQNPRQKHDIEVAALERVKNEFSAQKMAENTARVYESILR